MYIKKKNKKSFLNVFLSSSFVFLFAYFILDAEGFEVQQRTSGVSAEYLEIREETSNWYVSLGNIIVWDFGSNFTYVVQSWDSLYDIAQRFWTTVANLKRVNDLEQDIISEGDELTISQEEWILYELEEDIELQDFVVEYDLDIESIKSINYIYDEDRKLLEWDEIFIPITEEEAKNRWLVEDEEEVIVHHDHQTEEEETYSQQQTTGRWTSEVIAQWYENPQISNGFYPGHCTWYVAYELFEEDRPWWGNARNWYQNAAANGYDVWQEPRVWSIVVMMYWSGYWRYYGHVAIVEDINWWEREMLIREMNYADRFVVTKRWVPMDESIIGYIYY